MLRVDYGAEPLLDPRAGVFLSEAAFCWKAGQAGRFSAVLPPGHPLAGRVRVMDAASEVALSEGGRVTWQGRLTSIERRFDGSVAVEGEDALAYLNDTVVPPYANYAAPDYKGEPNAPRDAGELFAWLVERHNERAFLDSKRFCPGRSMAGRELLRSSTVWPTTASEIKSKLLATGGVLAVRYEAGEKVLDWLDDGAGEGGQEIEFGRNLLDFAREESAADVVNGIVPVSKPKEGAPVSLDGWGGSTRGDYVVAGGMVFDQAQASVQGVIAEKREYEASTPEKLVEMAMADLDSAKLAVSSIEVSAVDLSAIDPSVPPIRYLDWVTVSSRPHGFRASMLCVERRLDALDPSKTRYVFGASRRTLTGGQVRTEQYIRSAVAPAVEAVPALSEAAKAAAETAGEASASAAAAKSDAAASAERAAKAVEDAEVAVEAASKVEGRPGVSPVVSIERKGSETVISVTDAEGVKTASVADGAPGPPGADGRDADPETVARIEAAAAAAGETAASAREAAQEASGAAAQAKSDAKEAKSAAAALSTLVRETDRGVEVGKVGQNGDCQGTRTVQTADGFEVHDDGGVLAQLGKSAIRFVRHLIGFETRTDKNTGTVFGRVYSDNLELFGVKSLAMTSGRGDGFFTNSQQMRAAMISSMAAASVGDDGFSVEVRGIDSEMHERIRVPFWDERKKPVLIDGEQAVRRKVLYTAPSGANGFTQPTLSESAANFDLIEIFFHDNDGNHSSCRIDSPNGKRASLHAVWADNGAGGNMWIKSRVVSISGTSVKTYNNGTWNRTGDAQINSSTGTTNYYVANITIDKIVGYR